jgi:hypothetical protein
MIAGPTSRMVPMVDRIVAMLQAFRRLETGQFEVDEWRFCACLSANLRLRAFNNATANYLVGKS